MGLARVSCIVTVYLGSMSATRFVILSKIYRRPEERVGWRGGGGVNIVKSEVFLNGVLDMARRFPHNTRTEEA